MKDILIVDDQPYIQQLFTIELMDKNYTIISAEDVDKARSYLDTFQLDLVILDLYINGFYGWELLEEIKRKHPGLRVIILSAYDNLMNDPRAINADAYLIKDFQHVDLIYQKICDLIG